MQADRRPGRRTLLLLALILAAGMALRWWYLDWGLHGQRFYDERFSFANVAPILDGGGLEPANGYYPLLSYLPQALVLEASDALHRATGDPRFAVRQGAHFTAHAYRLARGVQAVYGVAAVWLTFLVGRRLFSATAGLVGALALALSPWHIHASAYFKPDVLLVLTTLAAFLWSLQADERPTAARHALAGAGVGLALSSKLTGGLAALPLVFATALRARREPRRLALLALAGASSAALFFAANPYWRTYLLYMDKLGREYAWKAAARDLAYARTPALTLRFLTDSLGLVAVVCAAAAAAVLLFRLVRRRQPPRDPVPTAVLLLFPPAYLLGYMAAVPQFKPNNVLPILPFVALLAGWAVLAAVGRLTGRRRIPAPPLVAGLALAAALVLFAPRGVRYVYGSITPTAQDLADRFLGRELGEHQPCLVLEERVPRRWPPWEAARPFTACVRLELDRLSELEPAAVARADGVSFRRSRLLGPEASTYLGYIAAADAGRAALFAGRPFAVRGPAVAVAAHPWRLLAPRQRLELYNRQSGDYRVEAALPEEVEAGEAVSFEAWLPHAALAEPQPAPRLRMGIDEVELIAVRSTATATVFLSPRLLSRRPGRRARLNRRQLAWQGEAVRLYLYRWQRPAG